MNKAEPNFIDLKMKMLNWANQFNIFCLLDNNGYRYEEPAFECLLAVGCTRSFTFNETNSFAAFQSFFDQKPSWLFGHLGYNATHKAYTKNVSTDFENGFFFEPEIILKLTNNSIEVILSNIDVALIHDEISKASNIGFEMKNNLSIQSSLSKHEYLEKIKQLQQHIKRGDCYEINFCQKFISNNTTINPIETYHKLIQLSPTPFATLYKLNDKYCLCASPERFLQKKGAQLISQPIKGTSRRDKDPAQDAINKKYLTESTKEKSENVMVVDLVRNDMSMVCKKGSVKVQELFGIYSFPQVHQMISTIKGTLDDDISFTQAIQACFPMGSMTGAPKQKVMELIEQYEAEQRDLFSGAIGYITPEANFDFNVVIRSIFYNETKKQVSFFAGSGITFYSKAEEEYEECLAKAEAIIKVLQS